MRVLCEYYVYMEIRVCPKRRSLTKTDPTQVTLSDSGRIPRVSIGSVMSTYIRFSESISYSKRVTLVYDTCLFSH